MHGSIGCTPNGNGAAIVSNMVMVPSRIPYVVEPTKTLIKYTYILTTTLIEQQSIVFTRPIATIQAIPFHIVSTKADLLPLELGETCEN